MTHEERETLVDRWLNEAREEEEDHRAVSGPFVDGGAESARLLLAGVLQDVGEDLRRCDYSGYAKEVDELLQSASIPALDHQNADFLKLSRRFLQA